ncbi:hypothetical protein [Bdellovibrio sp. HCB-110]|uniref:hypothetical protein n=1 Tax=Bdellovibrio sp. HCB-110 TaxID=3391182 RepID=UPI0039B4B8BA
MGRKFLVVLVLSLFSIFSSAAVPTNIDAQKWNELLNQVQLNGLSSSYPNGVYLSVSNIVPNDPTKDHQADYLSTVGFVDDNGNYNPRHVEAVSETWTLDAEGNWHVDQWIFLIGIEASIQKAYHREIVKTPSGMVTKLETIATTSEEENAKWSDLLEAWFRRMPLSYL